MEQVRVPEVRRVHDRAAPSAQTRKRAKRANIVGWLITVALTAGAALLILWSGLVVNAVATSSMVPTYKPTDMVVTIGTNVHAPKIGDAIVFEADYLGQHVPGHVHRIVAQNSDGSWTTKGDANADPDGWRVQPKDIRGTVIFSMPSRMLRNPVLIGLLLFGVLAVAFWPRNGSPGGGPKHGREGDPDSPSAVGQSGDPFRHVAQGHTAQHPAAHRR